MSLRYKFGPRLDTLNLRRPAVVGELPDVEVVVSAKEVAAGPNGTVSLALGIDVPAYTPGVDSPHLVAVHAIGVPGGTPEPADPAAAVAAPLPKGSADASGHTAGGELVVTLDGLPVGPATILTVLAFEDPAPPESPAV